MGGRVLLGLNEPLRPEKKSARKDTHQPSHSSQARLRLMDIDGGGLWMTRESKNIANPDKIRKPRDIKEGGGKRQRKKKTGKEVLVILARERTSIRRGMRK